MLMNGLLVNNSIGLANSSLLLSTPWVPIVRNGSPSQLPNRVNRFNYSPVTSYDRSLSWWNRDQQQKQEREKANREKTFSNRIVFDSSRSVKPSIQKSSAGKRASKRNGTVFFEGTANYENQLLPPTDDWNSQHNYPEFDHQLNNNFIPDQFNSNNLIDSHENLIEVSSPIVGVQTKYYYDDKHKQNNNNNHRNTAYQFQDPGSVNAGQESLKAKAHYFRHSNTNNRYFLPVDQPFDGDSVEHHRYHFEEDDQIASAGGQGCGCCKGGGGGNSLNNLLSGNLLPLIISMGTLGLLVFYIIMQAMVNGGTPATGRRKRDVAHLVSADDVHFDNQQQHLNDIHQHLNDINAPHMIPGSQLINQLSSGISDLYHRLEQSGQLPSFAVDNRTNQLLFTPPHPADQTKSAAETTIHAKCRQFLWRCLSRVADEAVPYIETHQLPKYLIGVVLRGGVLPRPESVPLDPPLIGKSLKCMKRFRFCQQTKQHKHDTLSKKTGTYSMNPQDNDHRHHHGTAELSADQQWTMKKITKA